MRAVKRSKRYSSTGQLLPAKRAKIEHSGDGNDENNNGAVPDVPPDASSVVGPSVPDSSPSPPDVEVDVDDVKQGNDNSELHVKTRVVTIAHTPFTLNVIAMKQFVTYLWNREKVRKARVAGLPYPWSDDSIINNNFFCNVSRVDDRTTQFLITNIIQAGIQSLPETFFRIALFRFFNRIDTWNLLVMELGHVPQWSKFTYNQYYKILDSSGKKLYCSCYFIISRPELDSTTGPRDGNHNKNLGRHLRLIKLMMETKLPSLLKKRETLRDAVTWIQVYPGLGPFLSYQLALDLNMTTHYTWAQNTWAGSGPGSEKALVILFGQQIRGIETYAMLHIFTNQEYLFKEFAVPWTPLSLDDIEHSLCEFEKYLRCSRKGSHKVKRWIFEGAAPLGPSPAPPSQQSKIPPVREDDWLALEGSDADSEEDGEDVDYELSHLVDERERDGEPYYLVHWKGYRQTRHLK